MILTEPRDGWRGIQPRRWQAECYPILLRHFGPLVESPSPACIRAIMGSGKSILMAQLVASASVKRDEVIVVSTPTIYLVQQLEKTFRARLETGVLSRHVVGTYYTHGKDYQAPVIVTCMNSLKELAQILQKLNKKVALWIADECHRTEVASVHEAHGWLNPERTIGMSVSGSSSLLIDDNGAVRYTTIEDLCNTHGVSTGIPTPIDGVLVRAFDGRAFGWKRVRALIKFDNCKPMTRIRTEFGRELTVTNDHAVYVYRNGFDVPVEVRGSDVAVGDFLICDNNWSPRQTADEIALCSYQNSDYWLTKDTSGIRIPNGSRGIMSCPGRGNPCRTHIPSSAIAFAMGFYIGNGSIDPSPRQLSRIIFSMHTSKQESFENGMRPLREYAAFRLDNIRSFPNRMSVDYKINNCFLARFLSHCCGRGAENKRIPDEVFSFDDASLRLFLDGLLGSDGHLGLQSRNRRRWYYATVSPLLAHQLVALLGRLNVVASIRRTEPSTGGTVNGRVIVGRLPRYDVHFSDYSLSGDNAGFHGRRTMVRMPFGGYGIRVKSVSRVSEPSVYDVSVDDDRWQTFTANGFLVHNTATPFRSDATERLTLFKKLLYDYGPKQAIADKNVVVPWRIVPWTGGETNLDTACIEMTQLAVGPGLYNSISIDDANQFAEKLRKAGIASESVHCKLRDSEITSRVTALRRGELKSLVHVAMLQEGADFPWLRWLCLRRPVTSRVRFVQEIGRTLRYYISDTGEEKTEAVLYDPHDLFPTFSLSYEAVLGGEYEVDKPDEPDTPEERLEQKMIELLTFLSQLKVGKTPARVAPLAAYLTELVNAFDLAGLAPRRIAASTWRRQAPSPKQLSTITNMQWATKRRCVPPKHRYVLNLLTEFGPHMNRGVASDLITVFESLADTRKWPDFKHLDRVADDGIKSYNESRGPITPTPQGSQEAPTPAVEPKDPRMEQQFLFEGAQRDKKRRTAKPKP